MSRHQGSRRAGASAHLTRSSNTERDSTWEWVQPGSELPRALTHGGLQLWGTGVVEVDEQGDGFTFECTGRARPNDSTL